jgi:hypothetical protein
LASVPHHVLAQEILLKEGKILVDKKTGKVSSAFKRLAKDVKKKEDELVHSKYDMKTII